MSVKGKGRPAERRKGDLVVKCQPTANGGHRKFVLFFIADVYGAGTESARRTYVDQFTGSGLDPLIISPARGHSEAVAYLMSKAGAGANVSALMYLRRPGTKQ